MPKNPFNNLPEDTEVDPGTTDADTEGGSESDKVLVEGYDLEEGELRQLAFDKEVTPEEATTSINVGMGSPEVVGRVLMGAYKKRLERAAFDRTRVDALAGFIMSIQNIKAMLNAYGVSEADQNWLLGHDGLRKEFNQLNPINHANDFDSLRDVEDGLIRLGQRLSQIIVQLKLSDKVDSKVLFSPDEKVDRGAPELMERFKEFIAAHPLAWDRIKTVALVTAVAAVVWYVSDDGRTAKQVELDAIEDAKNANDGLDSASKGLYTGFAPRFDAMTVNAECKVDKDAGSYFTVAKVTPGTTGNKDCQRVDTLMPLDPTIHAAEAVNTAFGDDQQVIEKSKQLLKENQPKHGEKK